MLNKRFHSSIDKKAFLNQLTKIIEENLHNEQFGVSELAQELGKSRSYIHRHLKSLKKQSVSQFIRSIRLQKAMTLLRKNELSAAEIAYQVGFSSPAYFSHCFHEHFGFPPGEVKKRALDEDSEKEEIADENDTNSIRIINKHISKKSIQRFAIFLLALSLSWFFYYSFKNDNFTFFNKNLASKDLTIFVSPFKNLSDDIDILHITEGIREDIIHDLYQMTSITVIPHISREKPQEFNLSALKKEQNIDAKYVLEGSVRMYNEEIRLSIRLIDSHKEDLVWAEQFDKRLDDILDLQNEIALEVAHEIHAELSEDEINKIKSKPTQNAKAYDYYLQARFLLHRANSDQRADFDLNSVKNCIQYYEQAIEEDNNFAEAYAGLASAWYRLSTWGWLRIKEGLPKAKMYSLKALEIDPNCAEARSVLAAYYIWGQRNFDEGAKEFITSIKLNPNFASSRQLYAQFLMITGPIEEARQQINVALTMEPYFWVVQNLSAWIYYFEGKHQKAIEACIIARDLKENFRENQWLFFLNYAKLGQGDAAVEMLTTIVKDQPDADKYVNEIHLAYQNNGIDGLFHWLIDISKNRTLPIHGLTGHPFFIAWWNAILKNKEETNYWLEKNLEADRKFYAYFNLIATNPDFKFLHNDPRFLKIVNEIGLSKYIQ